MSTHKEASEELARQLHEWYLEATRELKPENYNPNAQKPYDEMTEEQKFIDKYIAGKITQYANEARINEVHNFGNWNADAGVAELWPAIEARLAQLKAELEKMS